VKHTLFGSHSTFLLALKIIPDHAPVKTRFADTPLPDYVNATHQQLSAAIPIDEVLDHRLAIKGMRSAADARCWLLQLEIIFVQLLICQLFRVRF
jgi:hypothetical protein